MQCRYRPKSDVDIRKKNTTHWSKTDVNICISQPTTNAIHWIFFYRTSNRKPLLYYCRSCNGSITVSLLLVDKMLLRYWYAIRNYLHEWWSFSEHDWCGYIFSSQRGHNRCISKLAHCFLFGIESFGLWNGRFDLLHGTVDRYAKRAKSPLY